MPGEKILVVDDDPGLRTLMRARLEAAGYRTTLAEGGEQALTFAQGPGLHQGPPQGGAQGPEGHIDGDAAAVIGQDRTQPAPALVRGQPAGQPAAHP